MRTSIAAVGLTALVAGLATAAPHKRTDGLDGAHSATVQVDLGYEIHEGSLNVTGGFYTFSNIPYAQQPVKELRFAKPQPITIASSTLNKGAGGDLMCMQSYPHWIIDGEAQGTGLSPEQMANVLYNSPGQTEECLLLDVRVPAKVLARRPEAQAPVLIWIHGGGFTFGSKSYAGNPAGLMARAGLNDDEGVIFVSINYRLGLFGWLQGPDITGNLGLHDQRAAMEWVQTYISRFGGSPGRVTIMGESAGGSSVVHHITAYGGFNIPPFQAAIPQSPGFQYNINTANSYHSALVEAHSVSGVRVENVSGLKTLTSEQLKAVNQRVTHPALYGAFNFGPAVDGEFVPKLPQVLLAEGRLSYGLNIMVSHMPIETEAAPFVPPNITSDAELRAWAGRSLGATSPQVIDELLTNVYPNVLDGTYPWTTQFGRALVLTNELQFSCVARYLGQAYAGNVHAYIFAYPPGYHAADVHYEFYNGDTTELVDGVPINVGIAHNLQDTLVNFAKTGNPSVAGLPAFPRYGREGQVLEFSDKGVYTTIDDLQNPRCGWIQQALVFGLLR